MKLDKFLSILNTFDETDNVIFSLKVYSNNMLISSVTDYSATLCRFEDDGKYGHLMNVYPGNQEQIIAVKILKENLTTGTDIHIITNNLDNAVYEVNLTCNDSIILKITNSSNRATSLKELELYELSDYYLYKDKTKENLINSFKEMCSLNTINSGSLTNDKIIYSLANKYVNLNNTLKKSTKKTAKRDAIEIDDPYTELENLIDTDSTGIQYVFYAIFYSIDGTIPLSANYKQIIGDISTVEEELSIFLSTTLNSANIGNLLDGQTIIDKYRYVNIGITLEIPQLSDYNNISVEGLTNTKLLLNSTGMLYNFEDLIYSQNALYTNTLYDTIIYDQQNNLLTVDLSKHSFTKINEQKTIDPNMYIKENFEIYFSGDSFSGTASCSVSFNTLRTYINEKNPIFHYIKNNKIIFDLILTKITDISVEFKPINSDSNYICYVMYDNTTYISENNSEIIYSNSELLNTDFNSNEESIITDDSYYLDDVATDEEESIID